MSKLLIFFSQREPVYQQKSPLHLNTFQLHSCSIAPIVSCPSSIYPTVEWVSLSGLHWVLWSWRSGSMCVSQACVGKSGALFSKDFDNPAVRLQWAAFAPWQPALFLEPPGATNTADEMHSRWNDRAALFSFICVPSGRLGFLPVCVHESSSVVFTWLKYVNQTSASEAK